MKKKFIFAALLAIMVKGCLIYIAIHASAKERQQWKLSRKASMINDIPDESYMLASPVFNIERLYSSMKGPAATYQFMLDSNASELLWVTGFSVTAMNEGLTKEISNDFICHSNLDYDLREHMKRMGLEHRIDETYPRLMTLTQGQTSLTFPTGFGFPVYSDEPLSVITQVLNHNQPDIDITLRHRMSVDYIQSDHVKINMKPLFERSVFIMLPFDDNAGSGAPGNTGGCIPVDPQNHRYTGASNKVYTGHWVIPQGKSMFESEITSMMNLAFDTRIHYIGVHTHPFAESVEIWDLTEDSLLFRANCKNFDDKTGLKNIDYFSSAEGIPVYASHQYGLKVNINNTTKVDQDMMASMFLYLYDPEMDHILKSKP